MFDLYYDFYKKYREKYGNKIAIFLMVGSFYELYDLQNRDTGESFCSIREVCDILQIQVTEKQAVSSTPVGHTDLFAGFPDYSLHKHAQKLTSCGWTVVVVDQFKDKKGKVVDRKVQRILSPGTHIENVQTVDIPYITCIYFGTTSKTGASSNTNNISFGIASLDLTTGTTHSFFGNVVGNINDVWTADTIAQYNSIFCPKEIIIYWNTGSNGENIAPATAAFRKVLSIPTNIPVFIKSIANNGLGSFTNTFANDEYFRKIYSSISVDVSSDATGNSFQQFLGIRNNFEEYSLLFLMQFVEEHWPSMIRGFGRNIPWNPSTHLICGNHAHSQLCVGDIIDRLFVPTCITSIGKRAIHSRIMQPITDPTELAQKYDDVTATYSWDKETRIRIEKHLQFIGDLPRLHRKIMTATAEAADFCTLAFSYDNIADLHAVFSGHDCNHFCLGNTESAAIRDYFAFYSSVIQVEKAMGAQKSQDKLVFCSTIWPELGKLEDAIQEVIERVDRIFEELTAVISMDGIRMEEREKEPFGIRLSPGALRELRKQVDDREKWKKNVTGIAADGIVFHSLKSGGWMECRELNACNSELIRLREKLGILFNEIRIDACARMAEYSTTWRIIEEWIQLIDCSQGIGKLSLNNGWSRPVIQCATAEAEATAEAKAEATSFISIRGLRHPLIESLQLNRTKYVQHDVDIGCGVGCGVGCEDSTTGWLVYGMNASGKSTLMKAVGICIILAQAGCFVPASAMRFYPFHSIYTRILNQDNLYEGLSSFAVEMSEMRDILNGSNERTIVLGDELCSGTEHLSATAIVSAGIQWMLSRGIKFIFATHLHNLVKVLDRGENGNLPVGLKVWHLHVEYDPVTSRLVYDRKLLPGSGSTMYGLEVARAMGLPIEFIDLAIQNRHKLIGSVSQVDSRKNAWNPGVLKRFCSQCGSAVVDDLEVHHIVERKNADINGILPDGTPMNHRSNLTVLCSRCHDLEHSTRASEASANTHRRLEKFKYIANPIANPIANSIANPVAKDTGNPIANPVAKDTGNSIENPIIEDDPAEERKKIIIQTLLKYKNVSIKQIICYLNKNCSIDTTTSEISKMRKELATGLIK